VHEEYPDEHRLRGRCHAPELGLASAILGSTVLLLSPMVAVLATLLWANADRTPSVVQLHAWLTRLAVGIPILLVFLGAWLGIASQRRAMRESGSAAIPLAGLSLNITAFGAWILASIALLNTTESMLKQLR
jgi:hypothetical protein